MILISRAYSVAYGKTFCKSAVHSVAKAAPSDIRTFMIMISQYYKLYNMFVAGKGPWGSKPLMLEAHEDFLSPLAFQHAGPLLASGGVQLPHTDGGNF